MTIQSFCGNVLGLSKMNFLNASHYTCMPVVRNRLRKPFGLAFIHFYVNKLRVLNTEQPTLVVDRAIVNEKDGPIGSGAEKQKIVKVAVVGTPNAGKSTFINQTVGRRVCSISSKVHTTRNSVRAIMNEDNTQIIFLDTPGLISASESKRHNLEKSFFVDAELSMDESDVVIVIHDVSNVWTRHHLDFKVVRLLHLYSKKPVVLVMNKVDTLRSKRKLLDLTRTLTCGSLAPISGGNSMAVSTSHSPLTIQGRSGAPGDVVHGESSQLGWPFFENVFMISALKGEGTNAVKDYILRKAKVGRWLYPSSVFTDQKMEDLIILAVREKLLEYLPQEIPYNLETELEYANVSPAGDVVAIVLVRCAFVRHAKMLLGAKGSRIRRVAKTAEQALEATLMQNVRLNLVVQTKK